MKTDNLAHFNNSLEHFRKSNERLHIGFTKAIKIIAKQGWYISADISLIDTFSLAKDSQNGNIKALDNFMIRYFKKNAKEIIKAKSKQYQNRSIILKEALKAHKNKYYHASTILFLTQADGICKGELFKTKKEKRALKQFLIENQTPTFLSNFLSVLTEENPIDIYHPNKSKYNSSLNRHGVMHGYDVDYGTEINSLKALSILCFVADFIERHKIFNTAL